MNLFLKSSSVKILSIALAKSSLSFGLINKPTSSVIISLIPPILLPITGFPQAKASINTIPKLSLNEGKISKSELGIILFTSFLGPVK